MTSTSPINMQTAATGPAKGLVSVGTQTQAQAGGLMGFLTMLLQDSGMAAAQNTLAGPQGAEETAQTLAAKISDLLAQNGGKIDQAALGKILPPDTAPEMVKALADKLAALQQFTQAAPQDVKTAQAAPVVPTLLGDAPATSLTSDLTATTATTAQDEDLLKTLAEQLNNIAPGATDASDEQATADTAHKTAETIQKDVVAVKDDMMATLLTLQGDDTAQDQPVSPLALQAADAQAPQANAKALRASTSAAQQSPLLAQQGSTANASSGEPAAGDARGTSPHADASAEANARAPKQAPAINTPAASLAAQMQQVAPQAAQNNTFSGMLGSTLGALNSLLSGDGSFGGGLDQGFGGQHGLAGDAALADGMSADARLAAGQGSFTTYMAAAAKGAASAATTQMVGVQISRNANAKVDTFTMQLEPADLGALEVRMSFAKDGKVSAKLIADRPETLSLLQRDSMQLERILQQSGLDVGENALSFDLRDNSQQSMYDGTGERHDNNMYAGRGDHAHRNTNEITAQLAVQAAGYISQTGVNITV